VYHYIKKKKGNEPLQTPYISKSKGKLAATAAKQTVINLHGFMVVVRRGGVEWLRFQI